MTSHPIRSLAVTCLVFVLAQIVFGAVWIWDAVRGKLRD